jgi:hypothetical protein
LFTRLSKAAAPKIPIADQEPERAILTEAFDDLLRRTPRMDGALR